MKRIILLLLTLTLLTACSQVDCEQLEGEVNDLITEANYCEVDTDCEVNFDFSCPFGCENLVNKDADLTLIQEKVNIYYEECDMCIYTCREPPMEDEIKCLENKCIDIR
jgi:hypothetical protein